MSPNQPSEASQSKPAAGELTTLDPLNYDVKIKVFEDLVTHGFSFPNIFSEEAYKDFIAYLVARAPPAPSDQDLRSIIERAVRNKVAPITGINFMDFYYQFSPPGGSMPPKLLIPLSVRSKEREPTGDIVQVGDLLLVARGIGVLKSKLQDCKIELRRLVILLDIEATVLSEHLVESGSFWSFQCKDEHRGLGAAPAILPKALSDTVGDVLEAVSNIGPGKTKEFFLSVKRSHDRCRYEKQKNYGQYPNNPNWKNWRRMSPGADFASAQDMEKVVLDEWRASKKTSFKVDNFSGFTNCEKCWKGFGADVSQCFSTAGSA